MGGFRPGAVSSGLSLGHLGGSFCVLTAGVGPIKGAALLPQLVESNWILLGCLPGSRHGHSLEHLLGI